MRLSLSTPTVARRLAAGAAALAFLAAPHVARAQILKITGPKEPFAWLSAGVGYAQTNNDIVDGPSQSVWRFGNGLQYRASVEKSIAHQSSIGIAATYARMPLRYYDLFTGIEGQTGPCDRGCEAHALVRSLAATFHLGGGLGLHQVIEGSLGATRYSEFRFGNAAGVIGRPPGQNTDLLLAIGYGIGYSLGSAGEVTLVQDAAASFHGGATVQGVSSSSPGTSQIYTTRLSVRLGLGRRRAGV